VRRPLVILYILAFYILFQFCWWAYLLVKLNDEVYQHRIENVKLHSYSPAERTAETNILEKKIDNRRWMVIGEGVVFLSLLAWGVSLTTRAFRKEMALTRQQKNFLLSITHEFKSPLASIKLYMQTLLKHDLDREKEKSFINSAISDTERLNNLVENALLANLIDHKGYSFNREDVNFSALMRLLVQKYSQHPDHNKIESVIEEGLHIYADKNAIMILADNLLENASKYSAKNTMINISVKKSGSIVQLEIADEGTGIPDKEKKKVFEKFYRIGNEETRRTKGTGLGLFIVKYIVDEHKGKINIMDNSPHGTIIHIEFPLFMDNKIQ
jgi:two-component system, OmpR family, phosphate regulon sensor histidine kinase PhoR